MDVEKRSEIQKNKINCVERNNNKQNPKEEKKKLNKSLPENIIEECYLNIILFGKIISGKSVFFKWIYYKLNKKVLFEDHRNCHEGKNYIFWE